MTGSEIAADRPKLTARQAKIAQQMYEETGRDGRRMHTVEQIAAEFGVTGPTIYRHLAKLPYTASGWSPGSRSAVPGTPTKTRRSGGRCRAIHRSRATWSQLDRELATQFGLQVRGPGQPGLVPAAVVGQLLGSGVGRGDARRGDLLGPLGDVRGEVGGPEVPRRIAGEERAEIDDVPKPGWWPGGRPASFPATVRENEEVVPVNESTWVLPSGVMVGR